MKQPVEVGPWHLQFSEAPDSAQLSYHLSSVMPRGKERAPLPARYTITPKIHGIIKTLGKLWTAIKQPNCTDPDPAHSTDERTSEDKNTRIATQISDKLFIPFKGKSDLQINWLYFRGLRLLNT